MAQKISSMVLGLRRKVKIRVRQPLSKIMVPILDESIIPQLEAVKGIILSEINVKEMEFITDTSGVLIKKIKPNFKTLGPKHGKIMKQIAGVIAKMNQDDIVVFEKASEFTILVNDENIVLTLQDVEIISEDIPGWLVANEGKLTVALDVNITEELRKEGIACEFINRIQNLRKDSDFEVTDKISLEIAMHDEINDAVLTHKDYIGSQTLAESVSLVEKIEGEDAKAVEIEAGIETYIRIKKLSE
jgi:isoleucyl-tRNA synthetase